jgi:mRNA interferase MazF
LVLSVPFLDNERALYTIIPHTTAPRGTRFEVNLTVAGLEAGVFDIQGLRSIPPNVLVRRRATLTPDQLVSIESAVKLWLGLK